VTSGNFRSVDITSIVIDRSTRQRRELIKLDELAASIRTNGLINPPVIDEQMRLVAGERRLTACRDILGWTSITVQFTTDLSDTELHLIELEENVARVDLSWQDQCMAVKQYHDLQLARDGEWNASRSAEALNISPTELSSRRGVAQALVEGDPMVTKADKYSVARGLVARKNQRKQGNASDALGSMLSSPRVELDGESEAGAADLFGDDEVPTPPAIDVPFLRADFALWWPNYRGPKFNFIHCDFPYGVNADKHNQGASQAFGGYADSADIYFKLLDDLAESLPMIAADSAHMMFWFSMDYYEVTRERLTAMGWAVNPFPLMWHKSDNSGILPDPSRGPRRIYETAFLCSRGDRHIVQPVANVYAAPNKKKLHMSEKNRDMLAHFFRMFVDESTVMLDPTMGSGGAVVVAENAGAASALGLELLDENYQVARESYIDDLTSETE